ncbi:MAG: hypothetical protein HY099_06895, partial [Nitrospirae bacterium]|nr:hypothetical protein [Nitrospirota bacterium]
MSRKQWLVVIFVVMTLVAAGFAFASPYPDEVMKKIADIQELEKNKKEMPETLPGISIIKGDEVSKIKAKGA